MALESTWTNKVAFFASSVGQGNPPLVQAASGLDSPSFAG